MIGQNVELRTSNDRIIWTNFYIPSSSLVIRHFISNSFRHSSFAPRHLGVGDD